MSTYIDPANKSKLFLGQLDCPSFLREYLNYVLVVKNLSKGTVINYYKSIRDFLRWTQCRTDPDITPEAMRNIVIAPLPFSVVEEITTEDIYEYLSFSATVLDNTAVTRASKLIAINGMLDFFTEQGRLPGNPAERISPPKQEKRLPKYLTKEQCIQMLRCVRENPVSDFPERDYCMLVFFLNCGMRLSELVSLDCDSIRGEIMILYGKGRKQRIVYLNDSCLAALRDYLDVRTLVKNAADEPALFLSKRTGKRITGRRVEQLIEKMLLVSGFSGMGYSPHKLRHTAATLMYQEGADVLTIKEILGHESTSTTEIYTHLSQQQVKDVMLHSPLAEAEMGDSDS